MKTKILLATLFWLTMIAVISKITGAVLLENYLGLWELPLYLAVLLGVICWYEGLEGKLIK